MSSEFDRKVFVRDLKEEFHLTQITGNDDSLNRWIIAPDVNRPGLELTGNMRETDLAIKKIITDLAFHKLEIFPGVRETLETLSERYRLVLATKGDAVEQMAKVDASGLAPLALRSGIHLVHRDQGAGHDVLLFDLLHLHLYEIGAPALMRPRTAQHGDHLLLESILGRDPFGSGNMTSPHAM